MPTRFTETNTHFTTRLSATHYAELTRLAWALRASRADTLRYLISEAAKQLPPASPAERDALSRELAHMTRSGHDNPLPPPGREAANRAIPFTPPPVISPPPASRWDASAFGPWPELDTNPFPPEDPRHGPWRSELIRRLAEGPAD